MKEKFYHQLLNAAHSTQTWLPTSQAERSPSSKYVHCICCLSFTSNSSPNQATRQPPNYSVLHSPYQVTNSCSASQEISYISWNQMFHFCSWKWKAIITKQKKSLVSYGCFTLPQHLLFNTMWWWYSKHVNSYLKTPTNTHKFKSYLKLQHRLQENICT